MSDFILPDIGEGIVECELVKWLVGEGDTIEEDQPVVEVMTDKALVEITAPEAGRVTRLYYQQQENARVHSPLFAYTPLERAEDDDADSGATQDAAEREPAHDSGHPEAVTPPVELPAERQAASAPARQDETARNAPNQSAGGPHGRIPASPAVRRLVRELGVSLAAIPGSGKHGRVLKEDVLAFDRRGDGPRQTSQAAPTASGGAARVEPIRGMRAVMAKRMVESATTIPHFSYGDEIDVTELLALRERLKAQAEAAGTRLTLMPLVMKALALALQAHPLLNSRVDAAVSEIHYQPHCNIGMAVDSRAGLLVPNVKRVEQLSLLEIAREVARLTEAAREGRVGQADLADGTISISNIGALGGTYAAPLINLPEVAIVALGRTQWLPRFDAQGQVVSRAIMTVTWSGDHRVIDGGAIARFSNQWKGYLEDPQSMLLEMH
ncbi:2-oxo acid dehydrogenase subunit E2 [Modicisalibacter zincidurans]|uniref:Dihydrolipoamide acetyltransferase component of pyruvate dehydrogenase complex n=1 Tax=Modicisalibacter zincidurans TaxID=1178777 RepID=A0ABP9RAW1_9GAMM|nr:2-oxo acid dehydrogenase subunit E2 [Halomonas zincidurans]MEA3250265.1 2-oxo acid dehydrogenase subunit E2 [Pseudomonadota bacterium]